jgi:hypothetical protein
VNPTASPTTTRTGSHTWYVTPDRIWHGDGRTPPRTPPEVLGSLVALLYRVAEALRSNDQKGGTVLLDLPAAVALGLSVEPVDGRHAALDLAAANGWSHTSWGQWITFYGKDRPSVHVGQLGLLFEAGTRAFPFGWPGSWPGDMVADVEHWYRLTGHPWQAGPAVQGVELLHQLLPAVRLPDSSGKIRTRGVERRDANTPPGASEPPWSPSMWADPQLGQYLHGYDRVRAGLTAAGSVTVAATGLTRGYRKTFDATRGGWWQVSVPPWNHPHMPHPMGPRTVYDRAWVTTPTLELVAELARAGVIDMPEIIDSVTGPARPVLQPWARKLEAAYQHPIGDGYDAADQATIREAVKTVYKAALGMLGHRAGKSTIWRPDWYHSVNALKRANGWRKAWTIGNTYGRWPVCVDDDQWWYVSDEEDPYTAAPPGLDLVNDTPGAYRWKVTRTRQAAGS